MHSAGPPLAMVAALIDNSGQLSGAYERLFIVLALRIQGSNLWFEPDLLDNAGEFIACQAPVHTCGRYQSRLHHVGAE